MNQMNINYFADNNQSAKKEDKGNDRSRTVGDAVSKTERNRKIFRWTFLAICLGLLCLLVYFSCFANLSKKINPNGNGQRSITTSTLAQSTVKDGDTTYIIDLTNHSNSWSEYYANSQAGTFYTLYAKTDKGTINFQVREYLGVNGGNSVVIVDVNGTQYIKGDTDDVYTNWFSWALSANMTVPTQSVWTQILIQLIPLAILAGIMIWAMRKVGAMQGGEEGQESIFGIGKSQAKIAQSTVKFSDVAGIEEEKAELIEIVDYLKNPEKYAAMGARTPRGVILYGPPGTGKTLLAKAVAGEAKVPFFQVSGSAFEDMLVGVGAKRVRDLFNKAKKAAPAIIFIDELDSVASKRGKFDVSGGSSGLADQTINQLLAEMDGFSTRTGVVVMAATNRLDVLDDAILRPGRFDRHIQVNLPDIKEREAILRIHARNKNLSSKVHLEDIARRTPGFSGAQLENVLNEATLLAVRFGKSAIGMGEIDEAIDRVIAGPAKKSRVITEAEKKQIAYHEAGHALVGLHTPGSDVVEKITIIPRGYAAGYTLSTPEKQEIHIQKKSDLLSIVAGILGGRASEEVVYGPTEISTGAANDLYKVTNIVRSMVTQLGMSDVGMTQLIPSEGVINPNVVRLYSEQTAQKIDAEIEKIIDKQYAKAKKIIEANRKELDLIVESLLILETIVKNQIDYIHKHLELPQEAIEKKNADIKLVEQKNQDKSNSDKLDETK